MEFKYIKTEGISYIIPLHGADGWYWGNDYAAGDLYEAEDIFQSQGNIKSNRLVFVKYPEGEMYEPFKAKEGQYIGNPICCDGEIYFLVADFIASKIIIYKCLMVNEESPSIEETPSITGISEIDRIDLAQVRDCYNLMLAAEPLMLIRQGYEKTFEIIWPEYTSFKMGTTESFSHRKDDMLVFSQWYEDPDYREEIVIRQFPSGDIIERKDGCIVYMPDGQKWILV